MRLKISVYAATILTVILTAGCAATELSEPESILELMPFSVKVYSIAPNDVLHIGVYREDSLSGDYIVGPSGTINFPLIGRVAVSGKAVANVELELKTKLSRGYLKSPDVQVSVLKYQPVFITGEVQKPGEYTFVPGMTVTQGVAKAGGQTKFASSRYYLQRNTASGSERVRVDGQTMLYPGDIVHVAERIF